MAPFHWEFRLLSRNEQINDTLVTEIHRIFLDGFGLAEGWSREGIKKVLHRSTVLGRVCGPTPPSCYGYATYLVPDVPLKGQPLLWENGICLMKCAQGLGLTSGLLQKVFQLFPDRAFGWVGGRTQNPLIMSRYAKHGKLFPFDAGYHSAEGQELFRFMREHVPEVHDARNIDHATGICRGVYREGRLGDYQATGIVDTDRFEHQLSQWGVNREAGDAVVIVARLAKSHPVM